ncbi:RNA methyltransferase [Paraferrimonas sedimenticola]|uniref:23S rRNA methyltransferase n=1 Tax=Paraferrimonas sedimenticola TaxID=375674 RepID=A0AA37VSY4_9GAMM|nr:RNA methyltransferase [Paraferrimonas sedimenticola]GLP95004.1 23S rRNA methyltransferase [Paraferrimonas sedimenticola]
MSKYQATIALINPKSPSNVGSALRAAGCFQAQQLVFTGERYQRAARYRTDTHKIGEQISQKHLQHILDERNDDEQIVCVDLVEGATPLTDFEHPANARYVFGPEDGSISQDIIDRAEHVVYLPTQGCLNLAATVNIVLYDRATKLNLVETSDQQLKQSRDINNQTKVKARVEA